MEETPIKDKETKEARKVEEGLDIKRRIFDKNKKNVPSGTGEG